MHAYHVAHDKAVECDERAKGSDDAKEEEQKLVRTLTEFNYASYWRKKKKLLWLCVQLRCCMLLL